MDAARPALDPLQQAARRSPPASAPAVDIVPLGPPGCGKGTASKLVSERLGIPHLSTGDMLRALERDSDLGRRVFALIDGGNFVSDELITEMLEERIAAWGGAPAGVVLDGFPRTLTQLPTYDAFCTASGRRAVFVELVAPDDVCVERLERRAAAEGRADDTPEVIAKRLDVYRELTEPLVERLRAAGRLLAVDALQSPDEVAQALIDAAAPTPEIAL